MEKEPMTPKGYEKLKLEIEHIKHEERPANIKSIEEARLQGDLSENADYDAAKNHQGMIDARLKIAEDRLARAEVIDPSSLSGTNVMFGATVKLLNVETDEEVTYTIVGKVEADATNNLITYDSPLARGLIGKEEGDEVTIKTPNGPRPYGILEVKYL